MSDSFPSFIKIIFSSGHKCPISTCTPGTTLWVDDVSVSGGTVSHDIVEKNKEETLIYPNPARESIHILSIAQEDISSLEVIDIQGRQIQFYIRDLTTELDISDYTPGVYFIRITQKDNQIFTGKFVKK